MSEKRKRLVDTLESALDRLDAALQRPKDEFMRDSAIQRFRMLEHRNLTSHTYNVATAEAIYASLPDYSRMMREALRAVRDRG